MEIVSKTKIFVKIFACNTSLPVHDLRHGDMCGTFGRLAPVEGIRNMEGQLLQSRNLRTRQHQVSERERVWHQGRIQKHGNNAHVPKRPGISNQKLTGAFRFERGHNTSVHETTRDVISVTESHLTNMEASWKTYMANSATRQVSYAEMIGAWLQT